MRIVASVLTGMGAAFIAGSMSLLVEMGLLLARADVRASGGLGSVSGPAWFPYVAILGFVAGFTWQWQRVGR